MAYKVTGKYAQSMDDPSNPSVTLNVSWSKRYTECQPGVVTVGVKGQAEGRNAHRSR